MPVMRVSEATLDEAERWARPLETRPQVLDRMVQLAVEGPREEWLAQVLGDFITDELKAPIYQEDAGAVARYIRSRWPELRELAQQERLGPDLEVGGET